MFESFSRCFVLVNHLGGCSVWFCSSSEVGGGDGGINLGSDPGGDGGIHASAPMLVTVFVLLEGGSCLSFQSTFEVSFLEVSFGVAKY